MNRATGTNRASAIAGIAFATLFVFITGCGDLYGYGPVRDISRFESAMASPDGRRGVFTYHREAYRPASGWRAFPDGGIPAYVHDTFIIDIYDMETGGVKVVRSEPNRTWQPGSGAFTVSHISNGIAVLTQGGQLRSDYSFASRRYMLDLHTGRMGPLPIMEELAGMGLEQGCFYLVDDTGTLVVITVKTGIAVGNKRWESDESVPKEIWLRHPDGAYEKAADAIHYNGYTDGLVNYYNPAEARVNMIYDSNKKMRYPGGRDMPRQPDRTVGLSISSDSPGTLGITRMQDGGWVYTVSGVRPQDLF